MKGSLGIESRQVVVIGAGLGGLACAIRLAAAGCRVTVLERMSTPGGKLQRVEEAGYRFDRGPSTITMPEAFEAVFRSAGRRLEDYVTLTRLQPATRNVFADGTIVDACGDREAMKEQIARYNPEDAKNYDAFMEESRRLYALSRRHFLNRLLLGVRDMADPVLGQAFLRVRPWTTLDALLRKYFRHPHTRALFGRYATYVGAAPERAPAIFAMMAELEGEGGIYAVRGGTYELVRAFVRLAEELGVHIRTGVDVERIEVRSGRAVGVRTAEGVLPADLVIANADLLAANRRLLPEEARPRMTDARIERFEPSLSGFVVLAGLRVQPSLLRHHTVFFPERYGEEFEAIFDRRRPPEDPALYVCSPAYSEPGGAVAPAGGSALFILANAPYVDPACDWTQLRDGYRDRLLGLLEKRGLGSGLFRDAPVLRTYTPEDLERDTGAYRGAIYGISSNGMRQTFFRPSNRSPDVAGLWFVGGTTHPGGGTPIVVTSGRLVAERILATRP